MKTKNLNVINRLSIATLAFLVCFSSWGAPGSAKQINDIKRSGTCFHAESTAATQKDATEAATQMLAFYINGYINDNNLSVPTVSSDNIPGVKYLEVTRGTNTRVFAYVERSAILGGESIPNIQNTQETQNTQSTQDTQNTQDTSGVVEESTTSYTDNSSNESTSDYDEIAKSPILRTYTDALVQLVDAKDLQDALSKLGRLHAERIVKRFGPANKCVNKTWAFWMIYDPSGKQLEAFLSSGNDGERFNIVKDFDNDSLSKYTGADKVALWFEFW